MRKKEEDAAKLLEEVKKLINDRTPTGSEKVIATLPYLLPLLDSLEFGKFILSGNGDNVFVGILALISTIYHSIPFSGLVAFFALSILSNNPRINSLIRFNMKQAIYIDIAISIPALLGAFASFLLSGVVQTPQAVSVLWNDTIFVTVAMLCLYGAASSLLGKTPDKIPFLSDFVSQRLPRFKVMDIEEFKRMNMENKKDVDEEK